ncbi:uncharacterized protein LOC129903561 [Solanum dulcamara]|uniref:uncharacterized protein LOC129903561 n=1 Tax=Solanum dulcamara TaxID=45834 RepID=UPI0024864D09|nr:uncharacterized protein LOC129903561 [Solanum dulcamara]
MDVIIEAMDLKTLIMDKLIRNPQTHKLNKKQDHSKKKAKKDKSLAFKAFQTDECEEDEDMAYLTRRFQKIVRKHGGFMKKENSSKSANVTDLYHKCAKSGHFIRDFPMHKQDYKDYVKSGVKRALAIWGKSSSDSEESEHPEDASMLSIKDDEDVFDFMFAFMAKSEDDDVDEEVTLSDFKQNLNVFTSLKN